MKPQIVEVIWNDHTFYPGENESRGLTRNRSVGYFVSETKKLLRIAQSFQRGKFHEVLVIEKASIRKVKGVG